MFLSPILTTFNVANVVLAQEPKPWGSINSQCVNGDVATIQGLECVFANVVSVATVFAGLAVFIMLLIGAVKYLTSGGDAKASGQAKDTISHAILGLFIIVAAYLILNLISSFTGLTALLNFTIPPP